MASLGPRADAAGGNGYRARMDPRARHRTGLLALSVAAGALVSACSTSGASDGAEQPSAALAVVRVEVQACGGGDVHRATGVAVGQNLVATVAHTFDRGVSFGLADDQGRSWGAKVVWLDTARDLALLRLSAPAPSWLPLGDDDDGRAVEVYTLASDQGLEVKPATVLQHVAATLDGEGKRAALELQASIESGDSGSPVVDTDGEVIGLVFATSRTDDRGWAIAASEIVTAMASVGTEPIPLFC